MSKHKVDVNRGSRPSDPVSGPTQDFVTMAATIGVIAAGGALFEVALIPGMLIGGAAVLAPKYLAPKYLAPKYLPKLRRRLQPLFNSTVRPRTEPVFPLPGRTHVKAPLAIPTRFAIKQAIAKTITFRIIVTTLDFTTNYVVVGDLAMAVALSASGFILGPFVYLGHEMAWDYFGSLGERTLDLPAPTNLLPAPG